MVRKNQIKSMKNISSGLFWQLLGAMKRTGTKAAVERMDKGMPVLLLSGQDDPVGDQGKGVAALAGLSKGAAQMPFTRNFSRCSSR